MGRKLTALVLCLVLCLAGCAEPEKVVTAPEEPEVTPTPAPTVTAEQTPFTLPYYPDADLYPLRSSNRANMVLNSLVYQGLFELDNSFTPHGVLCSSYSVSDDGLIWTLMLGDAVFSDGTALTADDVIFSLETARTGTLYGGRLSSVQSIQAGADGSVILTLSQPNKLLSALLDIPIVHDARDGSMPLGTGPYRFVEDEGPLRLARTDSAPDTAPEEIPLLALEDADDLIYTFDAGNASLSVSDLTGSNALGYSAGYEAFDFPTTAMLYVGFQTMKGPCMEPSIRQAISRSFDRDTVAVSLLAGHAAATCLPFSPYSSLYSSAYEQAGRYDPAAVRTLLSEAGYTEGEDGLLYRNGTPLSLTFAVNTDNSFKLAIAEYLTGQLRELGMDVTLQKLAWDDYLAALESGSFDLYLGEVALTADFDLSALLDPGGTLNYGGYNNPQMSAVLKFFRITGMGSVLLDQFQQEIPLAPLCFKNHSVLIQWRAVSGLEPTRQNPFYHLESLRFAL